MSYPPSRYDRDTGEVTARFRPVASAQPDVKIGSGAAISYLATGASTEGAFGLYRWDAEPHTDGPAPHFHRTMSESFFVVAGRVRLYDGEQWIDGTAGDFLYVPEGGIHAFGNHSDGPASLLLLFAPGAPREPYFEGIAERVAGRHFSDQAWQEFCIAHDNYWVERPES